MTEFLIVLLMIIIGALIGGVTNSLAIKMLFRPYEPKYIGKWKVPLTPGLIPKRRDELARQLGKTVVDHLLTAEGLKKKLKQADFQQQIMMWSQEEVGRFISQKISAKEMLATIGVYANEDVVRTKIANVTKQQYEQFMLAHRERTVRELVGDSWTSKAEQNIEQLARYIQKQLSLFIASDTAKSKIGNLVETFLERKGFLGNMISSFLGNEALADKIQPTIVQYSQSEEVKDMIMQVLENEWNHLLDQPIAEVEAKFGSETVGNTLGDIVSASLPVESWLEKSVEEWFSPVKSQVLYHILPTTASKLLNSVAGRMEQVLAKLHLEEIVEKEVEAFPIQRVEQLVLNISSKEFKLITYLGALLGGLIGLIQGIFVVLFG